MLRWLLLFKLPIAHKRWDLRRPYVEILPRSCFGDFCAIYFVNLSLSLHTIASCYSFDITSPKSTFFSQTSVVSYYLDYAVPNSNFVRSHYGGTTGEILERWILPPEWYHSKEHSLISRKPHKNDSKRLICRRVMIMNNTELSRERKGPNQLKKSQGSTGPSLSHRLCLKSHRLCLLPGFD